MKLDLPSKLKSRYQDSKGFSWMQPYLYCYADVFRSLLSSLTSSSRAQTAQRSSSIYLQPTSPVLHIQYQHTERISLGLEYAYKTGLSQTRCWIFFENWGSMQTLVKRSIGYLNSSSVVDGRFEILRGLSTQYLLNLQRCWILLWMVTHFSEPDIRSKASLKSVWTQLRQFVFWMAFLYSVQIQDEKTDSSWLNYLIRDSIHLSLYSCSMMNILSFMYLGHREKQTYLRQFLWSIILRDFLTFSFMLSKSLLACIFYYFFLYFQDCSGCSFQNCLTLSAKSSSEYTEMAPGQSVDAADLTLGLGYSVISSEHPQKQENICMNISQQIGPYTSDYNLGSTLQISQQPPRQNPRTPPEQNLAKSVLQRLVWSSRLQATLTHRKQTGVSLISYKKLKRVIIFCVIPIKTMSKLFFYTLQILLFFVLAISFNTQLNPIEEAPALTADSSPNHKSLPHGDSKHQPLASPESRRSTRRSYKRRAPHSKIQAN